MDFIDIKKVAIVFVMAFVLFVACMIAYDILRPARYTNIGRNQILNNKTGEIKDRTHKSLTREEFIGYIRDKYPEYNNVKDDVLYNAIMKKYPVYKDWIK